MIVDLIPRTVLKQKIKAIQKRLGSFNNNSGSLIVSLDDYLIAGNQTAVEYFEQNQNLFRKLHEYHNLDPKCGSHSTYTYAAFLSLTEKLNRTELQKDVRWAGGIYVRLENKKVRGHHAWLEKRVDDEWKTFETIPEMRDMPAVYAPWYTFQLIQGKSKITSEQLLGLLAITTYGFFNS